MKRKVIVLGVLGVLCASVAGFFLAGYRLAYPLPEPPKFVHVGLHPAINLKGWEAVCDRVVHCGDFVAVSCRPETDGPLNYYNNTDGTLIMQCGGWPGVPNAICPPPEWACGPLTPP